MRGFKAFLRGMRCRDKQYEENTDYEENGGQICHSGMMHFCEDPLDVLQYYRLVDKNGYMIDLAEVEAPDDEVQRMNSKSASRKLHVGSKLSLEQWIEEAVRVREDGKMSRYTDDGFEKDILQEVSCLHGKFVATDLVDKVVACSGNNPHIGTLGGCSTIATSGEYANIMATGWESMIASTGDNSIIGALGGHSRVYAGGDDTRIVAAGSHSVVRATGKRSVVVNIGDEGYAAGELGDWITLAEYKETWPSPERYVVCVRSAQIDGEVLKPGVLYTLKHEEFIEVSEVKNDH